MKFDTQSLGASKPSAFDRALQTKIKALISGAVQSDPARYACLRTVDFSRLTVAHRDAIAGLSEIAATLAKTTADDTWLKAGRELLSRAQRWQTK